MPAASCPRCWRAKSPKKTVLAALLALVAFPLAAQGGPRGGQGNGPGTGAGTPGTPTVPAANPLATYVASLPKESLSSAETAQIAFLREEEKLARDVYRTLFAANGDRAFAHVAVAEQRHMDDVKLLLDRYGLADPASETIGEFHDSRLAALYTVRPIPTYVVIDHDGIVRGVETGYSRSTGGWLDNEVRKRLKEIGGTEGAR